MHQNRLFRFLKHIDELVELRPSSFPPGRHPEVHMRNAQLLGFCDLESYQPLPVLSPRRLIIVLICVIFLILRDQGRRRLRRTVKLAWNYSMKIVAHLETARYRPAQSNAYCSRGTPRCLASLVWYTMRSIVVGPVRRD